MQRRYDIDDVNEGIAYVAAFFTVLYYIPKVAPFINVIQGMVNFENTPGFQITICYINCLFWFLYGDLLFSDQMRIGYMVACIICLISMGIYLVYEIRKYFVDSVLNFLILVSSSWGAYRYFTVEFDDDVFLGRICIASSVVISQSSPSSAGDAVCTRETRLSSSRKMRRMSSSVSIGTFIFTSARGLVIPLTGYKVPENSQADAIL